MSKSFFKFKPTASGDHSKSYEIASYVWMANKLRNSITEDYDFILLSEMQEELGPQTKAEKKSILFGPWKAKDAGFLSTVFDENGKLIRSLYKINREKVEEFFS